MAKLTPVEFDPFAKSQKLTPVDFNPFETATQVPSASRTVLDQGLQGATFGFADEATDRIGAGIASALTPDLTYSDALGQARDLSKQQLGAELEERPVLSIASNLAGGLATGGIGAGTKTGATVGNIIRSGNLGSRIAKGAVAGAASGGLYGAGSADEGSRLQGATTGAEYGAVLGGALPAAGAAFNKLNTKKVIPKADEVRQLASGLYQKANQLGGTLKPEITNQFLDSIDNLRPQTKIGQMVAGDSEFTKIADRIKGIRDEPLDLQSAQELDEILGNTIDGLMDNGKLTKEGYKVQNIQNNLRDAIENATEDQITGGKEGFDALKEGRSLWSTSLRMKDLERIVDNANTFQVPATAIKSGFRQIVRNPKKFSRYSPEEQKAIKRASETGIVTDILNIAGSRLGPIISGSAAFATGGPIAAGLASAASYGTSSLARNAAESLQGGRAIDAIRAVADRSGLSREVKRIDLQRDFDRIKNSSFIKSETGAIGNFPKDLIDESDLTGVITGRPVTFNYTHNTDSAGKYYGKAKAGDQFGRDIEPSGKYMNITSEKGLDRAKSISTSIETGKKTFKNPIVIDNDNLNWKKELSKMYGGKTGKNLTDALVKDGYDGIITKENKYISEVIDLLSKKPEKEDLQKAFEARKLKK